MVLRKYAKQIHDRGPRHRRKVIRSIAKVELHARLRGVEAAHVDAEKVAAIIACGPPEYTPEAAEMQLLGRFLAEIKSMRVDPSVGLKKALDDVGNVLERVAKEVKKSKNKPDKATWMEACKHLKTRLAPFCPKRERPSAKARARASATDAPLRRAAAPSDADFLEDASAEPSARPLQQFRRSQTEWSNMTSDAQLAYVGQVEVGIADVVRQEDSRPFLKTIFLSLLLVNYSIVRDKK